MIYRFRDCVLDTSLYTLHRAGQRVPLRPKAQHMLRFLLESRQRVVSREELCAAVWPQQTISDATLSSTLRAVRHAIGDSGESQQCIYTVPGHGYRFIATVTEQIADHTTLLLADVNHGPAAALPPATGTPNLPAVSPPLPASEASRRQLTVLWCDLRDMTALRQSLDPERRRDVLQATHTACHTVITRYAGHIARQHDDGILVYFGYPQAQEEAALRAVQAGLECLESLAPYQARLQREQHIALVLRLGIHTGLVVMDTLTRGDSAPPLAVGEAPIVATRLPELAEPNTLLMSATTARLVEGFFDCQDLGVHPLPSLAESLHVYRVLRVSGAQHRLDSALAHTLPPLAGRAVEMALLHARWTHARESQGQVVLISGEPGIGKSRLIWEFRRQFAPAELTQVVFRCAPVHAQSAFYPVITTLQHFLQWQPQDTPRARYAMLTRTLQEYRFAQAPEVLPLLANLLSLPVPGEPSPVLMLSAPQQRQRVQDIMIAWLLEEAERRPMLMVWEDLHWADPSTREFLGRFMPHVAMAQMLVLCTFRPEFRVPWGAEAHFSHLVLPRLSRPQVETMLSGMVASPTLPNAFVTQVMSITDGVPLFIEELTKVALDHGVLHNLETHDTLAASFTPHTIPVTLHDTLLTRLERLAPGAEVARVAAVLGREFAMDVLQAVAPVAAEVLQQGLSQLLEAELITPQERYPTTWYRFKHALIQETAYQSLLQQTRQQYHHHVAQVLETQFAETVTTQPALLAHHYTEAASPAQAVYYWQQASQQAITRAAYPEAIAHSQRALAMLATLPTTPALQQSELDMQIALGAALMTSRGWADPGVATAHSRARELCRALGNLPQHFWALQGLWNFYAGRGELQTAYEMAEQILTVAQQTGDTLLLALAYYSLGITTHFLGAAPRARTYLEQGFALHDPTQHQAPTRLHDAQHWHVVGRSYMLYLLWTLGFPQQARALLQETLAQAMVWAYPSNMAFVLAFGTILQQLSRDPQATRLQADTLLNLSKEQGFPHWGAMGTVLRGWALVMQGQGEAGIAQMQHGLQVWKAIGILSATPYMLSLLADAYRALGQWAAARTALADAQALVETTGERWWEAELHRFNGELCLAQEDIPPQEDTAEACFQRALAIARSQQARSLELRAALSLGRLWQQHGQQQAAQQLLRSIYDTFSEGFDTADLQEARAFLSTTQGL